MQTHNYGVNGSQVNELGQHLPPMQVYGKYEPIGHMTQSAFRGISSPRVCDLIWAFKLQHGRMPTKYFAPEPTSAKGSSFHPPGLAPCFLDIDHDEGPERVE